MRRTRRRSLPALAVAGLAFLTPTVASADGPTASTRTAPSTVTLTSAPDSITAVGDARPGPLRLTLRAAPASDPTGVAVVELRPGHTLAEVRALDLAGLDDVAPLERIGRLVAGATARSGETYETTIKARARTYVAVDVTHERGPLTSFTVSGSPTASRLPRADARVVIRDHAFDLPARLPADGVLDVVNRGTRPHHAVALRIPKKLTSRQAVRLVRDGEINEPWATVDLVGLVSSRTRNLVDVHLKPGRYVIVSFYGALLPGRVPDPIAGLVTATRVR